jgi:protoporphyrinogen oxidase
VIATSGAKAHEVAERFSPELSAQLKEIETLSLMPVVLFFDHPPKELRGFGCLFPEDQNFNSLGVLFNSDIFEGRGKDGRRSES